MKYLLYSIAALVLVVAIGLAAVVLLVDPNEFRDEIAARVEQQTGRTFQIEGEIKLSVFPWIGLELGRVILGNAQGFGPEPFAELEGAEIRVKLIPLLSKRLEVKRVVLEGLRLSLAKDARGRTNWEDLARAEKKPAEAPEGKKPQTQMLADLVIGGLTVKDGAVHWADRQKARKMRIEHLNVNLGQWRFGEPTRLDLGFVLHLDDSALKETLSLTTMLLIDEGLQRFEFRQLALQSHTEGEGVPAGRLAAGLGSTIILDLAEQSVLVSDLDLQVAEASLRGSLTGSSILDKPRFAGQFKLHLDPGRTLASLDIQLPETADSGVLKRAELDFMLDAGRDDLALKELKGLIDDTRLTGQLAVASFANPRIRFQLAVDAIDVDRYLPEPAKNPQQTPTTSGQAQTTEKPLPLARLAKMNMNGTLKIGSLKVKNLQMEGVKLVAVGNGRVLTLKPEVTQFYRGEYRGKVSIDGRGQQPTLGMESQLQKVAVGPLLKDYLNKTSPLEGTAFMDLKLGGRGDTISSIKRTLGGNLSFHVKDGSLTNVEVLALIKQGEAWWKGEPTPPSSRQIEKLKFVGLDFLATVHNGVVRTDRFLIDSRKLRIEGSGEIDLVQEQLDYSMRILRMRHEADESGQEVAKARKLPIIIDITGPLAKPKYMLDVVAMAQARYQKKIDKKKAKVEKKIIEKLDKKLGPGVGDLLKGLISR